MEQKAGIKIMIEEAYNNIKNEIEIRKNLIEIKVLLKEPANRLAFRYLLGNDYAILTKQLKSDDAKIRKNAALIIGLLGEESLLDVLYTSYEAETQLFVKSSYLEAMSHYNYHKYLPLLQQRLTELTSNETEETNSKHIREEIATLQDMIMKESIIKPHRFNGYKENASIILMTNRCQKHVTASAIQDGKVQELPAGLKVDVKELGSILPIRTYTELLFILDCNNNLEMDPDLAAKSLTNSNLLHILEKMHEGTFPFYFRIELKSKMDTKKRGDFMKQLAYELEKQTNRVLINSTSNYEVELRLIENREGKLLPLLKLYTIPDERFSYRKEYIASSIHPVNAALIAASVKEYLIEDAQILDPFCGVGTMLIERHKLISAAPLYGIDIFGEAIDKARINANAANVIINYINRDFFDFKHDYLFDEIITNMPARGNLRDKSEIDAIYRRFLEKAKEVLVEKGIIIMYSNEMGLVKKYLRLNHNFRLRKEILIDQRLQTYVFVLQLISNKVYP